MWHLLVHHSLIFWSMFNACFPKGTIGCIFLTLLKTWTNSMLFVCANVGLDWNVLFFIDPSPLLGVQQIPFLMFLNLCFSIATIVILVHPFLVWMLLVFFNVYYFYYFSKEFDFPWFKPLVAPHLVTLLMFLLIHYYFLINDLPNAFIVLLLLLFNWCSHTNVIIVPLLLLSIGNPLHVHVILF
jgi:hypothetical protein